MYIFRKLFIAAALVCLLMACRPGQERFTVINNLLNDNRLDTAQIYLNHVDPTNLSEYDEAVYNLLSIKLNYLRYRPIPSDTLIRSCVRVFSKYNDKERLAESRYYQAVSLYEDGHVQQAFVEMMKAEKEAEGIADLSVRHKIVESLTDWNMSEHQYDLAMSYGRRNLELSTLAANDNWITYALVFISQIYTGMGERDSASHYLDKCMTYLNDVPDSQRVEFYNYIAALAMPNTPSTARSYVEMSNGIRENSVSYAILARIALNEGRGDEAEQLCQKAYDHASTPTERAYVLKQTMALYDSQHRYDRAYKTCKALMETKDAEARLREEHDVRNVQISFMNELRIQRIQQYVTYALFAIVLLLLCIILIILYFRHRRTKFDRDVMQNELLIKTYSEQMDKLKLSNSELKLSNSEMKAAKKVLENKVMELRLRQAEILHKGHKLYEELMEGKPVVRWGNPEYAQFIEYYKLIDLPYVTHLENDYNGLSGRYMLYKILIHMGKDNEEVKRILAICDSSLRSTKCRVKAKKTPDLTAAL